MKKNFLNENEIISNVSILFPSNEHHNYVVINIVIYAVV